MGKRDFRFTLFRFLFFLSLFVPFTNVSLFDLSYCIARRVHFAPLLTFPEQLFYASKESSIYEWHEKFKALSERYPDLFEEVEIILLQDGKLLKTHSVKVPKRNVISDYNIVGKYIATIAQNMLVTFGGTQLLIKGGHPELIGMVHDQLNRIDPLDGRRTLLDYLSMVYGDFSIGALREDRSKFTIYESPKIKSIEPQRIKGKYIGIDFGASSIKIVLIGNRGRLLAADRYDYKLKVDDETTYESCMEYKKAEDFVRKLTEVIEDFREKNGIDLSEIKGIGISWAGAVDEQGRIVGRAKIVQGLNEQEFEKIKYFGELIAEAFGKPVSVINDGAAGALWASSKGRKTKALILGVGSSVAGGYLDEEGKFPLYLLELAKVTVNMSPEAYEHGSTTLQGVLQQYLSLKGALNLAKEKGFKFPAQYKEPSEKFKYLKEMAEKGNATALDIFSTMGIYLGEAISELKRYLDFDNVVLFGGVVSLSKQDGKRKNNVRNIMIENARRVLKSRGIDVSITSVGQESGYSAAIGSVYLTTQTGHFKVPTFDFGNYQVQYRGYGYSFLNPFQARTNPWEECLESYLSGPKIAFRFKKFIEGSNLSNLLNEKLSKMGGKTLGEVFKEIEGYLAILNKNPEDLAPEELNNLDQIAEELRRLIFGVNEFINQKAKTSESIREFLLEIGREFGNALGFYLANIREILMENEVSNADEVISKVVLVGGVADNLGKDIDGDILLQGVNEGVQEVFQRLGISTGAEIKRSSYEGEFPRDFWAFRPQKEQDYSIVLTIGGTKIEAGAIDSRGKLVSQSVRKVPWASILTSQGILPVQKVKAKTKLIDYVVKQIEELYYETKDRGKNLVKIGISWAGPGRYEKGIVRAPNIWGFEEEPVNLVQEIKRRLPEELQNVEIEIQHDGICAAMGEISSLGTFPEQENIISVIWGTGIGAGILIDNRPYYALKQFKELGIPLGEIGHHIVFVNSIKVGGIDVTREWVDLVKKKEGSEGFPLCYKEGNIDWQEGAKTETKNVGDFRVSYNPARAKRPGSSVTQSQSKQECLFCKLELGFPNEQPWNELLRYKGFKILANPFPIVKEGHFTIIPVSEEHIPQELTQEYIQFALELVRDSQNLFLAFNSWIDAEENVWSAGATQPHFHFHGFYKGKEQLPIERAGKRKIGEKNGVEIYEIVFPSQGIMLKGKDPKALGEVLWNCIEKLKSEGLNYNVVFFKDEVYLFARQKEGEGPLEKIGALEMLGWFIISKENIFNNVTSQDLENILREVTVPPEEYL